MRLTIRHTTTYRYARAVGFNPHRLSLRPRGGADLTVVSHTLRCDPAASVWWGQDVFGNPMASATFAEPASLLVIESHVVVETLAERWPIIPIAPRAQRFPFVYGDDECVDLGAMAVGSGADPAVAEWARGFVRGAETDTLALLKDLNAGVSLAAAYEAREDEGVQSGAATLRLGQGSCRDYAALLIEAARSLGFGARAVSGYLFDPDGVGGLHDTTHAWAEIYLPDAGWIPFDPTHGRMGGAGLIPVASARRIEQIMPVSGSFEGERESFLGMDVRIDIRHDNA